MKTTTIIAADYYEALGFVDMCGADGYRVDVLQHRNDRHGLARMVNEAGQVVRITW